MGTTASLRSRVESSSLVARLAVGDALALTAFFAIGTHHHGLEPIADPTVVAEGVAPFLLTWALAAVVAGLYTDEAVRSPARAVAVTTPAWVLAALAGHGLRGTELVRGTTTWTFVAVTLVAGGVLVIGWRVAASVLIGRD